MPGVSVMMLSSRERRNPWFSATHYDCHVSAKSSMPSKVLRQLTPLIAFPFHICFNRQKRTFLPFISSALNVVRSQWWTKRTRARALDLRTTKMQKAFMAGFFFSLRDDACICADGIRKCSCPFRLRHIFLRAATTSCMMNSGMI